MSSTTLNVKAYGQTQWNDPNVFCLINYIAVDVVMQPSFQRGAWIAPVENLTTTPYKTFASVQDAVDYYEVADCGNLISDINSALGENYYTDYVLVSDDATVVKALSNKVDKVTGKGLSTEDYTTSEKTKLSGIASGATANDTDANLKSRANHTGSQAISTVTGLQTALDAKQDLISSAAHIADAATNAATNAPTNLNVLTTLLGTLTGEVNATNTKQNDLAMKYNDLATKVNTLFDHLEAQGLQTP